MYRDMIKYWNNFQVYMLIDTDQIKKLIKYGTQSEDYLVKNLATEVNQTIENFQSNLRVFYIKNGYAKQF
jgi:hypothetical protein